MVQQSERDLYSIMAKLSELYKKADFRIILFTCPFHRVL